MRASSPNTSYASEMIVRVGLLCLRSPLMYSTVDEFLNTVVGVNRAGLASVASMASAMVKLDGSS